MSKKGETKEVLLERYIRSLEPGTIVSSQHIAKLVNLSPISAGHFMRTTGLVEPIYNPGRAGKWRRI